MAWFCVINSACSCRECQGFMKAFGQDHVTLINSRPHRANYPDGSGMFVMTDLHTLDETRINQLVKTLVAETGDDPGFVRREILGPEGFPILVTDHRTIGTDLDQCRRVLRTKPVINS